DPNEPVYAVRYYNTWTGEKLDTHIRPHVNSIFRDSVPLLAGGRPDVAMKIYPAKGGDTPVRLELSADVYQIFNIDTMTVTISCYLFDDQDRFCPAADQTVTFELMGVGELVGPTRVAAQTGAACVRFRPSNEPGSAAVVVTATGLFPDTLNLTIKDREVLDDFEWYRSNNDLLNAWAVRSSSKADMSLVPWSCGGGRLAMQLDYIIGPEYRLTSIIEKKIDRSFAGGNFFSFWLQPDGSGRELEVRIYNQDSRYWYYTIVLSGSDPVFVVIPMEDFETRNQDEELDLANLAALRLTVKKGDREYGSGRLLFNDFRFSATEPSGIKSGRTLNPVKYSLEQNYPNPFNPSTQIAYSIAHRSPVRLTVYNVQGQRVDSLVNKVQNEGNYSVEWQPSVSLSSGIYFIEIVTKGFAETKKCLLVR
ncbi:T9SS type A sorting domain-containing protein, partial [candidate division KSB1 bacterium]|nr:T9SS type A sorting domain-containing protein [candidate division KSB1 bacterium]